MTGDLPGREEPGAASVPQVSGAAAVELVNVTKDYGRGRRAVTALDGVSVALPEGSFSAVMGLSGSGKTRDGDCRMTVTDLTSQ